LLSWLLEQPSRHESLSGVVLEWRCWRPARTSHWSRLVLWQTYYVHNMSAKATRVLNLVWRKIYRCTPEVKALDYTSLIRPHLEYASAAWDPYTAPDSHQLDKVHRAARFVKRDYRRTTSVSELTSQLGWQSLEECRKNACLSLFYKNLHGLAAETAASPCRFL